MADAAGDFLALGISLAVGLLVGSERGWHTRQLDEGLRVAGIRTFTLIALSGGVVALLARRLEPAQGMVLLASAGISLTALLAVGYYRATAAHTDLSITSAVAALLTFWLGALPPFGLGLPAMATAVVLALLLHLKGQLHRWLRLLDERELLGTLQFLIVSLVMLPLLPDRPYGPWGALNPRDLWSLVVLISGLSLVGYFAMRLAGARRGVLLTALTGGLVSSTSVTFALARLHVTLGRADVLAAGILLSCATMFLRIAAVVALLRAELLGALAPSLALGALGLGLPAFYFWYRRAPTAAAPEVPPVQNPFQLIPALQFGALLTAVMLLSRALGEWLGDLGLYLLAAVTGIADVDAIVLSLASTDTSARTAVTAIALAAAVNTLMKGLYAYLAGGSALGVRLLPAAAGAALLTLLPVLSGA
ncbi:MAG: membrane protein [Porticoccaceae bacterium]|nr:MAG: membrane protein [Porticoccaceae bacterium]